jgi:hypothetical protein
VEFHYDILPERRLILQRYAGQCSFVELISATRIMWSDTRYSIDYNGIVDLESASIKVALPDMYALAKFLLAHENTSVGRWAAVVTSPLITATAMIYRRAVVERHSLDVYSSWSAACAAFDVEPEVIEAFKKAA